MLTQLQGQRMPEYFFPLEVAIFAAALIRESSKLNCMQNQLNAITQIQTIGCDLLGC